jgi:hypothetical protein
MSDVHARPAGQAGVLQPAPSRGALPHADSPPAALRPRRPSWRDRRLVLGLLLVLGSTVAGVRLLGAEPGTVDVWVAARDLGAGTQLRGDDLVATPVRVAGSTARYVDAAGPPPVDLVLARPVGAGELLPVAALATGEAGADVRTVSVPVEHGHLPADLARGDLVDVYVTPDRTGEDAAALQVTQAAAVAGVDGDAGRFGGAGSTDVVLLTVSADAVPRLVGGLTRGTVDVVRVPSTGAHASDRSLP